tara:strand:- start:1523 stop:2110 length:588 start_codon:yes stop_codon:yes gene_type:complete
LTGFLLSEPGQFNTFPFILLKAFLVFVSKMTQQGKAMNKLGDFNDMLDEQIKFFSNEAAKHKNLYRSCRYAVSILGAVSAVLAALTFWLDENSIKLAIVISSAAAGFIAFREGLRKPYELWMNERSTSHALLDLQRETRFYLDNSSSNKQIESYFLHMQSIVIASGKTWKSVVAAEHKELVQGEGLASNEKPTSE